MSSFSQYSRALNGERKDVLYGGMMWKTYRDDGSFFHDRGDRDGIPPIPPPPTPHCGFPRPLVSRPYPLQHASCTLFCADVNFQFSFLHPLHHPSRRCRQRARRLVLLAQGVTVATRRRPRMKAEACHLGMRNTIPPSRRQSRQCRPRPRPRSRPPPPPPPPPGRRPQASSRAQPRHTSITARLTAP